jgi:uncharacterized protein YjiS (DUF1127 family)
MREAASFIASQSRFAPANVVSAVLQSVVDVLRAWNSRREVARLVDFDDRLLADIGLKREDLRSALGLPFSYDASLELQRRALGNRARGWRGQGF